MALHVFVAVTGLYVPLMFAQIVFASLFMVQIYVKTVTVA